MTLHLLGLPQAPLTKAWEADAFAALYNCSVTGKHGPVADRFWAKVDQSGGPDACWPWRAALSHGYAHFDRSSQGHRIAYELVIGPIPPGFSLDHLCHDPRTCPGGVCAHRACVNPSHLRPGLERDNHAAGRAIRWGPADGGAAAAKSRSKTHCPKGHPYDEANTYISLSRPNIRNRQCRACHAVSGNLARNERVRLAGPKPRGPATQESRARLAEIVRARWADPDYHARTTAAIRKAVGKV